MTAALAVAGYALRACLPPKRRLGLLALAGVVLVFGVLARTNDEYSPGVDVLEVTGSAVFGLVLPIAALVVGDAVLGAEIRSGSFVFTWLSPVRLSTIVLMRWLAGTTMTCAVLVPAVVVGAVLGDGAEVAAPFAVATAVAAAGYVAVFMALGAAFRRAAAASLVYVFLVERLLGSVLSAIAQITPGWLGWAVLTGWVDDVPDDLIRSGVPSGAGAVVRLAIVTAVALTLTVRSLRRLKVTGAAD